jgi:hypothetical protein
MGVRKIMSSTSVKIRMGSSKGSIIFGRKSMGIRGSLAQK